MSARPQHQVHPAASALLILLTLAAVQWVWWRFLVYRAPTKPGRPQAAGAGRMVASINLVGRTDVVVATFSGDRDPGSADGPGHSARLDRPTGLALDSRGNVYVADTGNNRIRRISPEGDTTTVAGGDPGYADGDAAAARFNMPCGISVGPDDTIYVADTGNQCIRRIASGQVTTLVGKPPSAAGAPPANGDLVTGVSFVPGVTPALTAANCGAGKLQQYRLDGSLQSERGGAGRPVSVFGEGAAFADTGLLTLGSQSLKNTRIQTDDSANAELAAKLSLRHPIGLCKFGADGWLVTDSNYGAVLLVVNGKAQIVAGYCSTSGPIHGDRDGNGASCLLGDLSGLAFDGKRYAYVADTSNNLIRRLDVTQLITH